MSTEYYATKVKPSCRSPIKIGLSSNGDFTIDYFVDDFNFTYDDKAWAGYLWLEDAVKNNRYVIVNEYDEVVPWDEIKDTLREAMRGFSYDQ